MLFASFIEYAIENKVTKSEWSRFVITHYPDPVLENARVECTKLLLGYGEKPPEHAETKEKLYTLAKILRENT